MERSPKLPPPDPPIAEDDFNVDTNSEKHHYEKIMTPPSEKKLNTDEQEPDLNALYAKCNAIKQAE